MAEGVVVAVEAAPVAAGPAEVVAAVRGTDIDATGHEWVDRADVAEGAGGRECVAVPVSLGELARSRKTPGVTEVASCGTMSWFVQQTVPPGATFTGVGKYW